MEDGIKIASSNGDRDRTVATAALELDEGGVSFRAVRSEHDILSVAVEACVRLIDCLACPTRWRNFDQHVPVNLLGMVLISDDLNLVYHAAEEQTRVILVIERASLNRDGDRDAVRVAQLARDECALTLDI